jgi:hypothetical protein
MENFNKFGWMIAVIIAIIAPSFYTSSSVFGGASDSGYNATANGVYAVDGTTVIDGSGNWVGAITGTAGTLSGLLTLNAGTLHSYPNATTTKGNTTLKQSDVDGYDTVLLTANEVGITTLTFPASSTMSTWLPTAGDRQRTCFVNATTTASVQYTFAGGTGTTLLVASSSVTALGSKNIGPQKVGCFEFIRAPATPTTFDIIASFTSFI